MSSSSIKKEIPNSLEDNSYSSGNCNNAENGCDRTESETAISISTRHVDNGRPSEEHEKFKTITLNITLGAGSSSQQQQENDGECFNPRPCISPCPPTIMEAPMNAYDCPQLDYGSANSPRNSYNAPQCYGNGPQNPANDDRDPCNTPQNYANVPRVSCNKTQNCGNAPRNTNDQARGSWNPAQDQLCAPPNPCAAPRNSFNCQQNPDYAAQNADNSIPQCCCPPPQCPETAACSMATPCVCQKDNNYGKNKRVHACGRRERLPGIDFDIIDENIEAQAMEQGKQPGPKLYLYPQGITSKYSRLPDGDSETPLERSFKITPGAREDIDTIKAIMVVLFAKLNEESELMLKRDFSLCKDIIDRINDIQITLTNMMENLRYSPYSSELSLISTRLHLMVRELTEDPPFVLLRLVEFGWNVYEIGVRLRVDLLPPTFAVLIHKIQNRIYRLNTGRVVRQIYFVPIDFDPVVGTYYKSRRLIRMEQFCHCHVVLLPPTDPRHIYCPNNYRTMEVNFDYENGRHLGFIHLLNQCATSPNYTAKLAATILRRLSGLDIELTPTEMYELELTTPRVAFADLKANLVKGTGLAYAPKIIS